MTWTSKTILSLAELIIYCALTPLFAYTAFKHRLPSLSGHIFIFAFIGLRLVTDGLAISKSNQPASANVTGAIINSIGLSPLLLAIAGYLNEARFYVLDYRNRKVAKRRGLIYEIFLHLFVVGGVVLLALGRSNLAEAKTPSDANTDKSLEYAGAAILLLAWLVLCALALHTAFVARKRTQSAHESRNLRLLAYGLVASLVFTGIRVIYTMTYTFGNNPQLQPQTATFAIYFFLLFLSQLVAALVIAATLLLTRHIHDDFNGNATTSYYTMVPSMDLHNSHGEHQKPGISRAV